MDDQQSKFWDSTNSLPSQTSEALLVPEMSTAIDEIVFHVYRTEALSTIPAWRAAKEHRQYAQAMDAETGKTWYIIRGSTYNGSHEKRRISSSDIHMFDSAGNEFSAQWSTLKFLPESLKLRSGELLPGQIKHWLLFFEVPQDLGSARLLVTTAYGVDQMQSTLSLPGPATLLESASLSPQAAEESDTLPVTPTSPENAMLIDLGNRSVVTGEIEHTLVSVEVMSEIPAERTTQEWKDHGISEVLPAPGNTVWIHVIGSSTNHFSEARSMNATFSLIDSQDREFKINVSDTLFYVDDDRSTLVAVVEPGESQNWEAWFLVHRDAEDLRLKLDDLTFLAEFTAQAELPIDNALIASEGIKQ